MFEGWGDFYIMLGPAAASLIGLLFIVVTLTSGADREKVMRGQALYMTPMVVQFAVVIIIASVALAPDQPVPVVAVAVGLGALLGLGNALRDSLGIWGLRKNEDAVPHWTDFWWYGVAPAGVYLALAATDVAILTQASLATEALAVTSLLLLLVAIRNAWDLITWIAPMRNAEADKP